MAAVRMDDVLHAACLGATATADADAGGVEFLLNEAGRRDVTLAAEDVEDGGAEVGEASGSVVAFGAVDGHCGWDSWFVVVVRGEGGVGDEVGGGVEGGPEGADEGEDFLVLGGG